jgi:cytochrome oxidase Cu insertion factor (SCO1/SenC/PrrC family)
MRMNASRGGSRSKAAPESFFSPRRLGMAAGVLVFPISAGTILYIQELYTEPPPDDGAAKMYSVLQNRRNAGTFQTAPGGGADEPDVVIGNLQPATGASLGGPFQLYDSKTGKLVTDTDVFKGHWTLLYFGFTRCAEICPNCTKFMTEVITTSQEKYGRNSKEDEETRADASKMQICFISVDHIRDRPADLTKFMEKYAKKTSPSPDAKNSTSTPWWKFWSRGGGGAKDETVPYVGLVGKTKEEVTAAASAWRVYVSSVEETDEERLAREAKGIPAPDLMDDSYQVDHSAAIYFIGPDGQMKDFFFREIGVEQTVDRIGLHFADVYGIKHLDK